VELDHQRCYIPVSILVRRAEDDLPQVLFTSSPFDRFSTKDASHYEPLLRAVAQSRVAASYTRAFPADLSRFDVILIGGDALCVLDDPTRKRLREHVSSGGRLIVTANAFLMESIPAANTLLQDYGLEIVRQDGRNVVCSIDSPNEIFREVKSVSFQRPSPIRVTDKNAASLLISMPGDPDSGFLAVSRKQGEVLVLTQSLWWWWIWFGKDCDNSSLFQNLIRWRKRAK
jgi:hypothetical protein